MIYIFGWFHIGHINIYSCYIFLVDKLPFLFYYTEYKGRVVGVQDIEKIV